MRLSIEVLTGAGRRTLLRRCYYRLGSGYLPYWATIAAPRNGMDSGHGLGSNYRFSRDLPVSRGDGVLHGN